MSTGPGKFKFLHSYYRGNFQGLHSAADNAYICKSTRIGRLLAPLVIAELLD